ncbi:MAG: UDP-N-acetylglucosamine--N-acetylmuramyl-(pentapeptide) pyrophosphoryl-undecaprenol N-acetylglucosamine transferase [Candidatus Pacebacteria bacterium]|nr:UDP-N-acetylglucosamine--N-acetylmuramyl-(pentapeptide) pyrophosphoryl-undecaprenol N-acetylglucosamine transferase [Candidatus Paceibacterota bacterium]MCF7857103.1 UDP-N-acetylglucosamine--N-acetylmuramyl-(pentapeptide) pyrophosphoryl-undecaprenol N-acetylglucosamine transferase [Candidatus Paceibacterota bacterium]
MNDKGPNIRILFVGGGTGGHFYPLIAIAESLRTHAYQTTLYYAGPDEYDKDALITNGIKFVQIPSGKRRRYFSILNFFDTFKTVFGICIALIKLLIIYPDVVMSKGGFTSVPVVVAAWLLRIPIVIHESDSVPGKANVLASRFAQTIVVAYPEIVNLFSHPKILLLGIPIRQSLLSKPREDAYASLGIDSERPVILILGGSQGAEKINRLILDSLDELLVSFTVIHQTGKSNYELCKLSAESLVPNQSLITHYHPTPFLDGPLLNDAYHSANVVISRAGSTSIYEIAIHGKPAILIPIPESISHDQRTNAYAYSRTGAAIVLEESNFSDTLLSAEIGRIMSDKQLYAEMSSSALLFGKRDAAEQIKTILLEIAEQH